jgi:hypothetical protein
MNAGEGCLLPVQSYDYARGFRSTIIWLGMWWMVVGNSIFRHSEIPGIVYICQAFRPPFFFIPWPVPALLIGSILLQEALEAVRPKGQTLAL